MQTYMINIALGLLTKVITEEMVINVLNTLLTAVEQAVKSSENDLDDTVIIPVLTVIRSALKLTESTDK